MKNERTLRLVALAGLLCVMTRLSAAEVETALAKGPWGEVEVVPIEIRLPAGMVPDVPLPVQPWVVEKNREETARLLDEAGVERALAERMLSTYSGSDGGRLQPTAEMIREIDAGARSRLYEALRRVSANTFLHNSLRFRRERLGQRFRDLSPTTVALLGEFLYETPRLRERLLLADLPSVMQLIEDRRERTRLIQAISEQESLLLRLNLDASSDPGALADYWGRGGRRRDLEILIGSLVDDATPRRIDVIYLLPAFARAFLLTYPRLENAQRRDCFWTALNFFLPTPDDRLAGPKVARTMVEQYELVKGPLQLGDMLVLWRPTGEAEHAAVYIAGDVYFTKNGNNLAMPWLFMRLADILDRYDEAEQAPLTHYRLGERD